MILGRNLLVRVGERMGRKRGRLPDREKGDSHFSNIYFGNWKQWNAMERIEKV